MAVRAWRPGDALVALACIVPFGSAILVWLDVPPVRLSEAFVIATLSGAWVASLHRRSSDAEAPAEGRAPVLGFCIVVLASLVVVLAAREVGVPSPRLELRNLWMFLTHDYLVGPAPEFGGLADAALLLEGVALMWIVRRRASGRVALLGGAFMVSALGGAWMAFAQAAGFVADANGVVSALLRARASGPVYDVNAAGSFFAMAASFAIACAAARHDSTPARAAWATGAGIFGGAVALSGLRMAVVATIAAAVLVVSCTRLRDSAAAALDRRRDRRGGRDGDDRADARHRRAALGGAPGTRFAEPARRVHDYRAPHDRQRAGIRRRHRQLLRDVGPFHARLDLLVPLP